MGREEVLEQLRSALEKRRRAMLVGMPGVGKTKTAIEYAHRHRKDYTAVLWAGADSPETLTSGYVALARLLGLPQQRNEPNQAVIVAAVRRWLGETPDWLLILDNVAGHVGAVRDLLPADDPGHLLLTTRDPAFQALAQPVVVAKMTPEEGARLLLQRAGRLEADAPLERAEMEDCEPALALSRTLDGLPLALDQAGAYIVEKPGSPAEYLELYEGERAKLLADRGAVGDHDHASVSTTFALAFTKVEAANPATADLLRLGALLAPEAIPEEIFLKGALVLGDRLGPACSSRSEFNSMISVAYRLSLLQRDPPSRTLSIHRLVQDVMRGMMDGEARRLWAERAVRTVSCAFPDVEYSAWPACERLLPHALSCFAAIEPWEMDDPEAARLLNQTAFYLKERTRYSEAEPLVRRALAIREAALGPVHPDTARSLNDLAALYYLQGRYAEAEPLCCRALAIREAALGQDHLDTARSLNSLADLYHLQGRYAEAEPLCCRALAIREAALGQNHPHTARGLNKLAFLYYFQGRYAEVEPLWRRALAIREAALGSVHPDTACSLNNLAYLYSSQGRYAEAEPLARRALAIWEKALGPDHPDTARSLDTLAYLYRSQGRYAEAEPPYRRALAINEKALGPDHPDTANSLNELADLYRSQGRYAEAEPLCRRALAIHERAVCPDHPDTARSLTELAGLLRDRGRYGEAEPLLRRALAIREKALGPDHPDTARSLTELAGVLRDRGRYGEAEPLLRRALAIREKALGPDHPDTLGTRHQIAHWTGEAGDAQGAASVPRAAPGPAAHPRT